MGTRDAYLIFLLVIGVDRQIIVGYSLVQKSYSKPPQVDCNNRDFQATDNKLDGRPFRRTKPLNAERRKDNLSKTAQFSSQNEGGLSELDSRVLQSILKDTKLDFETEEGIRKLLERGIDKVGRKQTVQAKEDSEYSSKIFKTLADTKLWKALKAKSTKAMESLGIWVINKIENDVKVLAALGVFAWDRIQNDVARALPEAKERRTMFLLSNSSAFVEDPVQSARLELELSRPLDEFKIVSREFLGILSGQRSSTTRSRGLRNIAPAGSLNAAERQKRAFLRRQKINQQTKDISRIAGNVVDSAWELNRELTAERNSPGYKTEPIRVAISAAANGTQAALRQAAIEARLGASAKKKLRSLKKSEIAIIESTVSPSASKILGEIPELQPLSTNSFPSLTLRDIKNKVDEMTSQIQAEIDSLAERINRCIQYPGETWLRGYSDDSSSSKSNLRQIVTKLILIRNQIEAELIQPLTLLNVEERLERITMISSAIEELCTFAPSTVGANLRSILVNVLDEDSEEAGNEPKLQYTLRIDALSLELKQAIEMLHRHADPESHGGSFFAQSTKVDSPFQVSSPGTSVAVEPDLVVQPFTNNIKKSRSYGLQQEANTVDPIVDVIGTYYRDNDAIPRQYEESDESFRRVVAEVIEDTELSDSIDDMKQVKILADAELQNEQRTADDVLSRAALRSLDVIVFVLEKLVTTGLPATLSVVSTVALRLQRTFSSKGKSTEGWQTYDKLSKNIRGKY